MRALLQRLAVLAAFVASASAHAAPPVTTVPKVDAQRYAGTWYELARLPNRFQEKCAGDVTATYAPNPDGSIAVVNRCRTSGGEIVKSEGRATRAGDDTSGAQLEVSFLPSWLQWFPLGRGDYWVVMLDPEYRYAVVSEPSREYLWILARAPSMDAPAYESLVEQLRAAGYPVERLVRTPHSAVPPPTAMLKRHLVWRASTAKPPPRVVL